jgi:hypothetical protein
MVLFIGTMLCSNSSEFIIQAIAIKIQSIPVFWCRIFAEHAWQQSLKTGNFFARFYFPLFSACRGTFLGKKTSCTDWGPTNAGSLSFWTYGNTAQFPPDGLSTAPAAAARHLRCQNAR